jgi:hypothetical protein
VLVRRVVEAGGGEVRGLSLIGFSPTRHG